MQEMQWMPRNAVPRNASDASERKGVEFQLQSHGLCIFIINITSFFGTTMFGMIVGVAPKQ